MRNIIFIFILALWSCESGPPNHIPSDEYRKTFNEDARDFLESFTPSNKEINTFEVDLKKHLEELTFSGKGFERNVLDKVQPLEYSLGWFKRRYFGKVDTKGTSKLLVEFVFVRCGGSGEWEEIDYPSDSNSECWWSVEYDIENNKIEKINYLCSVRSF